MSLCQQEFHGRCAPIDWRPGCDDVESRRLTAEAVSSDVVEWLDRETGRAWDVKRVVAMLLEAAPAGEDADGYSIARNFEKFGVKPNAEFVEILDEWPEMLYAATRKREMEEAQRLGIDAPFGVSASAVFHQPEGKPIAGTVFRIPEDRLGRCAFVPAMEGVVDGVGELTVLSVGLEDVEVVGPADVGSTSLHAVVMSAVDGYENQEIMERLGHQADLDIGMFDADVAGMIDAREAAGSTHLSAHIDLVSSLVEASREAMEDGNLARIWVASLLCAAAARRLAMVSGDVPDAAAVGGLIATISASEDDAGVMAGRRQESSVRFH